MYQSCTGVLGSEARSLAAVMRPLESESHASVFICRQRADETVRTARSSTPTASTFM
jgi:hypothetical protein